MTAQDRMERARSHRDELGAQIAGYFDIGEPVPTTLLRRWDRAQDALDAARNAVRREARTDRGEG